MTRPKSKQAKRRINLELSEDLAAQVDRVSARHDLSFTAALRLGLKVLVLIDEAQADPAGAVILRRNGVDTPVILL